MNSLIQLRASLNDLLGYSKHGIKQNNTCTDQIDSLLRTTNSEFLNHISELKQMEDLITKKKNGFCCQMKEYQELEDQFERQQQKKHSLGLNIDELSRKITPLITSNEQKSEELSNIVRDYEKQDKGIDEKLEIYRQRLYNLKQSQSNLRLNLDKGVKQKKQRMNQRNELLQMMRQNIHVMGEQSRDQKMLSNQLHYKIKLIQNLFQFLNRSGNQLRRNKKHNSFLVEKPYHKKGSSDPQDYLDFPEEQMVIEDFIASLQSQKYCNSEVELGLVDSLDDLLQGKSSPKKKPNQVESDPSRRHKSEVSEQYQEIELNQQRIRQLNKEWELQKRTKTQETFDEKDYAIHEFNNILCTSTKHSRIVEQVSQKSQGNSCKNSLLLYSECGSKISNQMEIMTLKDELSQLNFDESQFWINEGCKEAQSQMCKKQHSQLKNLKKMRKVYQSEKMVCSCVEQEEVSEEVTCQETSCASVCLGRSEEKEGVRTKVAVGVAVVLSASSAWAYWQWRRRRLF